MLVKTLASTWYFKSLELRGVIFSVKISVKKYFDGLLVRQISIRFVLMDLFAFVLRPLCIMSVSLQTTFTTSWFAATLGRVCHKFLSKLWHQPDNSNLRNCEGVSMKKYFDRLSVRRNFHQGHINRLICICLRPFCITSLSL